MLLRKWEDPTALRGARAPPHAVADRRAEQDAQAVRARFRGARPLATVRGDAGRGGGRAARPALSRELRAVPLGLPRFRRGVARSPRERAPAIAARSTRRSWRSRSRSTRRSRCFRRPSWRSSRSRSRAATSPRAGSSRASARAEHARLQACGCGTARVRCWSKEEWPKVKYEYGGYAGTVDFAGFAYDLFRVSIDPKYCASPRRPRVRHARPTSGLPFLKMAASVALLAHEAGHLFESETNEAATEYSRFSACASWRRSSARSPLTRTTWRRPTGRILYPRNPPGYRTQLCYDGGPLDLNPERAVAKGRASRRSGSSTATRGRIRVR